LEGWLLGQSRQVHDFAEHVNKELLHAKEKGWRSQAFVEPLRVPYDEENPRVGVFSTPQSLDVEKIC